MRDPYCPKCGTRLIEKDLKNEGVIPWCETCGEYRFPMFNTAVSMIVVNESERKILLIKQYGRDSYILVAGYVNKGEDAEDAVRREIKEEMDLKVLECHFNRSHYFAPSNTLMLNFTAIVEEQEAHPNTEVDAYKWFSIEEARANIRDKSLAQAFLNGFFDGEYHF
jgi:NAD+ diphosphatase